MSLLHSDDIAYLDRITTALESIAWSLTKIEEHLTPQVQKQEYPLDTIPGLDNLVGRADGFTADGNVIDYKVSSGLSDSEYQEVDAASLAREAEELLNAASTPDIKEGVDIGEGGKPAKPLIKINLFKQERLDIAELVETCMEDPIIQQYVKVRDTSATPEPAAILGAAIALVYQHLPREMWGGEEAAKAVKQFVAQHSENA